MTSFIVIIFVQLLVTLKAAEIGHRDCLLEFTEEPPSNLNCRPFDNDNRWNLRLACEVRITTTHELVQYEVHWFQRKRNGTIIDHGREELQKSRTVERVAFGLNWINQQFVQNMTGDFWCQAILTNQHLNNTLPKSTILSIREPTTYSTNLTTCSGIHFIREQRCLNATREEIIPLTSTISPTSSLLTTQGNTIMSSSTLVVVASTFVQTATLDSSTSRQSLSSSSQAISFTDAFVTKTMSMAIATRLTSLMISPTSTTSSNVPPTYHSLHMLPIVVAIACALTLVVCVLLLVLLIIISKWKQNKEIAVKITTKKTLNCPTIKPEPFYIESAFKAEPYYIEPAEPHYMQPVDGVATSSCEINHSYESLSSNTDYVSIYDNINTSNYEAIDPALVNMAIYADRVSYK